MTDRPPRYSRSDTHEARALRELRARQPELAEAVDMHLELLEVQRRLLTRIPLPSFDVGAAVVSRHQADGRPLLRFEDIPLELTDLRLVFRQTTDVMRRFGAIEEGACQRVQAMGRDETLLARVAAWYAARDTVDEPVGSEEGQAVDGAVLDQVFTLAMRPFLSRCAEVLQASAGLSAWTHAHCPLCAGQPDFAVVTPAAERHLICGRCALQWKFDSLACPYCRNADRSRITSFATSDGQYRVYACDVCTRYLKVYDARRATRPVMPVVDSVATLPLDAAAMQRGYR